MSNRKILTTIFLIGLISIYSIGWYFISQNMNGFLIKRMEIKPENIKLAGYPFSIKFKINDAQIEDISYNLFSRKLALNLKKSAFDSLGSGQAENILKDIEYITFSAKLDSYFTLMQIIQDKGTKFQAIDAFNLFGNIELSLKADIREPNWDMMIPISARLALFIPNKRQYLDYEDILSDLPKNLILEGDYEEKVIENDTMPSFIQKIVRLTYPSKSKLNMKATLSKHIDVRKMDEAILTELMRGLNIDWSIDTDSISTKSESSMTTSAVVDTYNINIINSTAYKSGALQNFYEAFNSEDIAETIETIAHRYNIQLTDNNKIKLRLLADFILENTHSQLSKDPNYLKKFDDAKGISKISLSIPYKEGFGGMKYFIELGDDKHELGIKLDGVMRGNGVPEGSKGILYLNNKSHNISEAIEFLRLLSFAINNSVSVDNLKHAIDDFEKDKKTIDDILISLSDDPASISDKTSYSYDITKTDILNSKFSETGKTLSDALVAFSSLFVVQDESVSK